MIDYKNTLNLPRTKFSMRANLPVIEIKILKNWYTNNLYKILRLKKNKKKIFLLHDGPPYANGRIHLGHSINKILKDIILKSKGLSGYDTPYIPGWDCHGLPIELKVEQLIKKKYLNINDQEFRKFCRKYALKQVQIQKEDFIRLGILGDWENPYLTMDFKTEANIIRTLNKVVSHGYFYKGVKPVYWCVECVSALANSEVEYQKHSSYAVDLGFSIIDNSSLNHVFNVNLYDQNIELVIWTTAIWTLPANQAISVHPEYVYQLVKTISNRYIIIASGLLSSFMKRIECFSWMILGEAIGKKLEHIQVKHPFMNFNVPIILSRHIQLNSGTGIVHIAPNYGPEDYTISKKYNLKNNLHCINEKGYYIDGIHPSLNQMHIFQSHTKIVQLLYQSNNFLYIDNNYKHSYPYCWRHNIPLIFRVTAQWFLSMNHKDLRKKLLQESQKVTWLPDQGFSHIKSMIINRPDWCLSRQRIWGIPIPIFVNKKTDVLHPKTFEFMEKIANLVEIKGIQAWWDLKIEDFITDKTEVNCYKKVNDVLDVWFDSGSTYDSVISKRFEHLYLEKMGVLPIDLYLEGLDQYRGWFMSSLIISVAINGYAPYKTVLTHGFTVDSQGNKMSKSIGNIIRPKDIIDKFGADILRLWIAYADYSNDITISDNNIKQVVDIYRRIRNTIRFFLANLNDFNPETSLVLPKDMVALDCWAIDHTLSVQSRIIFNYNRYQFHNVVQYIIQFCSIEMGSIYLDIIKDRQW